MDDANDVFAAMAESFVEAINNERLCACVQHVGEAITCYARQDFEGYAEHVERATQLCEAARIGQAILEEMRDEWLGLSVARWADDGGRA